jgi:hypothetical protein
MSAVEKGVLNFREFISTMIRSRSNNPNFYTPTAKCAICKPYLELRLVRDPVIQRAGRLAPPCGTVCFYFIRFSIVKRDRINFPTLVYPAHLMACTTIAFILPMQGTTGQR